MKGILRSIGVGLCFAGLLVACSAQASLITLDENGNWTQNDSFTITSSAPGRALDPATGLSTLEYLIQNDGFRIGWVGINDLGDGLSDLIHFTNTVVNGKSATAVFFYSSDVGTGDLADVWPSTIPTTAVTIYEDANGIASYSPTSSEPGYYDQVGGVSWQFDSVPEPATVGLVAIGLLGALTIRRRKV